MLKWVLRLESLLAAVRAPPVPPVLSYSSPSTASMAAVSSTTRFITARTERGSRQLSQSRVSTLLRSICDRLRP
uniref:Putative secreted protein n=1 Tax=Anopheles marajoara TaxID=58244 RepID=A0A2M4CDL6_9DIPT